MYIELKKKKRFYIYNGQYIIIIIIRYSVILLNFFFMGEWSFLKKMFTLIIIRRPSVLIGNQTRLIFEWKLILQKFLIRKQLKKINQVKRMFDKIPFLGVIII